MMICAPCPAPKAKLFLLRRGLHVTSKKLANTLQRPTRARAQSSSEGAFRHPAASVKRLNLLLRLPYRDDNGEIVQPGSEASTSISSWPAPTAFWANSSFSYVRTCADRPLAPYTRRPSSPPRLLNLEADLHLLVGTAAVESKAPK